MKKITAFLKDPKIFVVTIIWMMIIVSIGTIQQKYYGLFTIQERYFSSWVIWFSFFPTPGGRLTMIIMLINLSFSFFNKSIWKIKKLGIVIIHLGFILLLVGGGLTAMFSSEGNMVIDEGKQANHVEDYFYFELAIINTSDNNFDLGFIPNIFLNIALGNLRGPRVIECIAFLSMFLKTSANNSL